MAPVDVLNINPAGNAGLNAKVNVPNPPVAVIGAVEVIAVFWVSVIDATACVNCIAGGASTVRLNDPEFDTAGVLLSVTVIVYEVWESVDVDVPEIDPVDALKVNPVGSVGDMLYERVPVPPVAVTGAKGVTATSRTIVLLGTAIVMDICRCTTSKLNDFELD